MDYPLQYRSVRKSVHTKDTLQLHRSAQEQRRNRKIGPFLNFVVSCGQITMRICAVGMLNPTCHRFIGLICALLVSVSIQTFLYTHWLSVQYVCALMVCCFQAPVSTCAWTGYVCPDFPDKLHAKEGYLKLLYSRNRKKKNELWWYSFILAAQ